ncbi:MAG: M20 family metallopeptidase [Chloroflexi bacterium]|nr:M20 family metallopeptidase [Chloroflexota bacterium]
MHQEMIQRYFETCEDQMVAAITKLVSIRSVRGEAQPGLPFGKGPAEALAVALTIAGEMGFATDNVDNYVGTVDLNDRETRLGILCHLDVVAEGSGWSTPPYTVVQKDGMLFGRGASDDKGPLVAALFALKAVKDLGIPLKYNARLILGTDEETDSADIKYYFARHAAPPYTFSPDGFFPLTNTEKGSYKTTFTKSWAVSNALPRITAVKGGEIINVIPGHAEARVEGLSATELHSYCDAAALATGVQFDLNVEHGAVRITAAGKGGHAASPQKANNALTALLSLLAALPIAESDSFSAIQQLSQLFPHGDYTGQALGIAQSDEISGPLTISFNIFEQTLEGFKGRFDSRTPLCATRENCIDVVDARFAALGIQVENKIISPHHTPCDSPFVQTLLAAYEQYTGLNGFCESTGGGTYVHDIEGGVAFGAILPGFEPYFHGADERVRVADLLTAAKIFTQVIIDLCA